MTPHRFKVGRPVAGPSRQPLAGLAVSLLLLGVATAAAAQQQRELPRPAQPARVYNLQGQVSLPEGMPASNVLVTIINRGGVPRQVYANEHGRFEFAGMPEGAYSLSARSLTDPGLTVEGVEADTTRAVTGNLHVNLILRRDITPTGVASKAEILTAAEAEQKVPRAARRAFKDAVKFREENQPGKALESLGRAVELYPDYFQAHAERGDLLVAQHKLADACKDFERALKLNARYGPALRGAGYCKLEGREFAEAARYLEQSVSAQPANPNAYLLLGIAYLELDRREQARAALLKALGFNTRRELRAHIYLGNLYARSGQFREAADELRKYLDANPSDPAAAELQEVESKWRARAAAP